jgi:hypothetical protein
MIETLLAEAAVQDPSLWIGAGGAAGIVGTLWNLARKMSDGIDTVNKTLQAEAEHRVRELAHWEANQRVLRLIASNMGSDDDTGPINVGRHR